jgi:hypothetical protein
MRARRVLALALFSLSSAVVADGSTEQVQIALRADKTSYKIGESIGFEITYKNVSPNPIALLTESETYPVDAFIITRISDHRRPEKIRFGVPSIAWDALADDVVKVRPQAKVSRRLTAEIRSILPSDYKDKRRGVFLIFPASAALLPGFGKYEIKAHFHSSLDHPVNSYLPQNSKLWRGDVLSAPVVIDIRE